MLKIAILWLNKPSPVSNRKLTARRLFGLPSKEGEGTLDFRIGERKSPDVWKNTREG
jgi:hypothetical protein